MADRRSPPIALKKEPKQARSAELVATVLEAALEVLAEEGAQRFTTARVADRAGVSVGSLYQYFPNKASILFRLQQEEWQQTTALMANILGDTAHAPLDRQRAFVHAFIKSECEEASFRVALDDCAPLYRDAPEAHQAKAAGRNTMAAFLNEALPLARPDVRDLAGDLILTTLSSVGKNFSEESHTNIEIERFADSLSDMFCAYLEKLMAK
jgi:AcrR family transcriptional regulator